MKDELGMHLYMKAIIVSGIVTRGKKDKMEIRKLERGRCSQHLGDDENTEKWVYVALAFTGITKGR